MSIDKLKTKCNNCRDYLNAAIHNNDAKQITVMRGRLIRTICSLLNRHGDELDPSEVASLRTELDQQMKEHKVQIDKRKSDNKKAPNYSITEEIGLKIRKTASSARKIVTGKGFKEKGQAVLSTAFGTISTALSVAKIPFKPAVFIVKKAGKAAGALTGYAIGIPLDVARNLFGKVIDPDTEWTWEVSQNISGALGKLTENTIGTIGNAVIRM